MTCRIELFGDSILKGVVLDDALRYQVSDVLQLDRLGADLGVSLENRSRFGCTSEKGFALLERCLSRGDRPDAVVLGYGGNDADFDWAAVAAEPEAQHIPHTPLPHFAALYRDAIARLRALQIEPILISLPPVCAGRYFRWITRSGLDGARILQWLGDVEAIYRYQEQYSRILEQLARDCGCRIMDLRGALLQNRRLEDDYCIDGIHPNSAGQAVIRGALAQTLAAL